MMIRVLLPSFLLLLLACHPDKNKPVDLENYRMKTSDGSKLYFKNVRQSNYNLELVENAGIEIYTLKGIDESMLYPRIIHNWRLDQAFLDLVINDTTYTALYLKESEKRRPLKDQNFKKETSLALEIYNAILKNQTIYLNSSFSDTLVFNRELFRVTCFDYLRITDNR